MQVSIASVLLVACVAPPHSGAGRKEELFTAWKVAQRSVKSLVVEFTLEVKDGVFGTTDKGEGIVRLLRTPKGEVHGTYDYSWSKDGKSTRVLHLLHNGTPYWIFPQEMKALRFTPPNGDLQGFLETNFHPLVRLLVRERAQKEWRIEVAKQDRWYTYLDLQPKSGDRQKWYAFGNQSRARIVLNNTASPNLPKDMPRQFWYRAGNGNEFTHHIKSWRMNAADGLTVNDFARLEDLPGWEVVEWPW